MKFETVRARTAFARGRLDAKYHCSDGVAASERILQLKAQGFKTRTVAGEGGYGSIGATSRTKRVYAADGEIGVPYLRPYDTFDYLPRAADVLSVSGSANVQTLMPAAGTILQTCSGRNLGPSAYVDDYLAQFVVSDDMLRLHIKDETERLYVLAYLSSPTGQAVLTRSKTGNVIDHLSADDLAAVEVPAMAEATQVSVANKMREAIGLRERGRFGLEELVALVTASVPTIEKPARLRDGWTARGFELASRMDAAYWEPGVVELRRHLAGAGCVRLGDYADTHLPNWYKRHYVEPAYGRPIVSGRQLLQATPINLQYIAARSLVFEDYELGEGTVAFGARGRAEDRLSQPALIMADRASWLGSENVMRVRPREGVNPGWLFLALSTEQAQAQIRSATYGAVVDVVDARRLADVLLPNPDSDLGDRALTCWGQLELAGELEREAIDELERSMRIDAA